MGVGIGVGGGSGVGDDIGRNGIGTSRVLRSRGIWSLEMMEWIMKVSMGGWKEKYGRVNAPVSIRFREGGRCGCISFVVKFQ